jgi:hypothetical protein
MPPTAPSGDLARCITHEADESWPVIIEIVAYFGEGRRKRLSVEIPADQFFGRNGFGAPMSGEQIVVMIDKLRRQK